MENANNSQKDKQTVNIRYLQNAMKPETKCEGANINASLITELLPDTHVIQINRKFETKDPVILEYYYKLAQKGQFGARVGYLISLDAYGKIPQTSSVAELSNEEKLNQLVGTINTMVQMIMRTQRMTESNMSAQAKTLKYVQGVALTVKSQGAILQAIESVLVSENKYTSEEIKYVLDGIKKAFSNMNTPTNTQK